MTRSIRLLAAESLDLLSDVPVHHRKRVMAKAYAIATEDVRNAKTSTEARSALVNIKILESIASEHAKTAALRMALEHTMLVAEVARRITSRDEVPIAALEAGSIGDIDTVAIELGIVEAEGDEAAAVADELRPEVEPKAERATAPGAVRRDT